MRVATVIEQLERLAPPRLAADWDNVGLLLGDQETPLARVMTCLTVTPASAAEAVARQAGLIVSHHPVLFRAVKRLTTDTADGRMLLDLVRAGVAVYSPHTGWDNARGGINDQLTALLGLGAVGPLRRIDRSRQVKVVVFVPENDLPRVSEALFAAGAGQIGEYRECSFRLAGTGTFFGSASAHPTIGQKGRREEAAEWRLEVVCPENRLAAVVAALRQAHSYEEPAFDVYPLVAPPGKEGEGRVGELPHPTPLRDLAGSLRAGLRCGPIQLVGDPERAVRRVAIVCGAGGELMADAMRTRADLFLTGEMRFHDYLAAQASGLALLLPGHHATERFAMERLAERLRAELPGLEIWASEAEADPGVWL